MKRRRRPDAVKEDGPVKETRGKSGKAGIKEENKEIGLGPN
jgi:hypothetical protein